MIHRKRIGLVLLIMVALTSVGCRPGGLTSLGWEDWETAYYKHGKRIVVDRFEIDVRNTEAMQRVIDYRDKHAVISAGGDNLVYQNDLEILAVKTRLAKAMRQAPDQRTIRRTTQHQCSVPPGSRDRSPLRLPEQCVGERMLVLPPGAEGADPDTQAGMTYGQSFELKPGRSFEEGMEITIRSYVRIGPDKADRLRESKTPLKPVLHDIPLFLKPGQSIILRTNPSWSANLPAILQYEENGQRYETIYLISYVEMDRRLFD